MVAAAIDRADAVRADNPQAPARTLRHNVGRHSPEAA
jgi:hypothetical protein